jgi:hypothetical protein
MSGAGTVGVDDSTVIAKEIAVAAPSRFGLNAALSATGGPATAAAAVCGWAWAVVCGSGCALAGALFQAPAANAISVAALAL